MQCFISKLITSGAQEEECVILHTLLLGFHKDHALIPTLPQSILVVLSVYEQFMSINISARSEKNSLEAQASHCESLRIS